MQFIEARKQLPDMIVKLGFTEAQTKGLLQYWTFFSGREDLQGLAQKYYRDFFEAETPPPYDPSELPEKDGFEEGGLFAMIYLVRYACLEKTLALRGIPASYKENALWHLKDLLRRNEICYGTCGFLGMYRDGMLQYLQPRSYTLGRLTFEISKFNAPYAVYKNGNTGEPVPMALPGFYYGEDGRRILASEKEQGFEPTLVETQDHITGYTFSEKGLLIKEPVVLDTKVYTCVLKKGDPTVSVHIPAKGKLTGELVEDAFRQADAFFAAYYPEREYKAYYCSSWLLDTDLEQMLKPGANILQFQKYFRIVMSHINDFALYWNIFQTEKRVSIEELKPINSFQQNVLDWLKSGKQLYSGNGFILKN